ncbi:nuclear transport factor 2 family protein [Streptomyces sp. DASNCL29]|uniref:nuclear transport factor 2 family protein n=1 Tax=Streptomyces sp. DASNCL29 TaxID=2583819 RepID=UPI001486306B|nr:nuclear transport factor 2 family protein [Streptomyces sp. DASNCL29]
MSLSSRDLGLSQPTTVADDAMSYAVEHLSDYVMGHSARSFLFVRPTAAAQGLEPRRDYDEELVFLICLLRDLGVSEVGNGRQRFEVDGADVARAFLLEAGFEQERADKVWAGIALHTSDGIAPRFSPEAGVAQVGIATDIAGIARDAPSADLIADALDAWPRHDLGYAFAEDIAAQIAATPEKASPISFPGHVTALGMPPGQAPTWYEMVANSGWGDRPLHRRPGAPAAAETPDQLTKLFLERFRARDLDGLLALYEPGAAAGRPTGGPAAGHEAIRADLSALIDSEVTIELTARSAAHGSGLALLSHTAAFTAPDGTATVRDTTEVARRQADGRWPYAIGDPFFSRRPSQSQDHLLS